MKQFGTRKRILDKLKDRVSGSASRRDIKVVEFKRLDDRTARLVATFSGDIPSYNDMVNWAIEATDKRLRLVPSTLASYDTTPHPMISFMAELNENKKPFAQAMENKSLTCVAQNTYLDEDLGVTWEKRNIEGKAFLIRVEQDGIDKILQAVGTYIGPKTSKIAKEIVVMAAYSGDKVSYMRPDTSVGCGTVLSVDDRGFLTIKDDSTHNVYERPLGAVLDVISEGAESKRVSTEVANYFKEYLGEDLAGEMFK